MKAMSDRYEVGGVLEDSRLIRLNEPLPCKQGQRNRVALEALDRFLAEDDGESSETWTQLEKIIDQHPLKIRKGSLP